MRQRATQPNLSAFHDVSFWSKSHTDRELTFAQRFTVNHFASGPEAAKPGPIDDYNTLMCLPLPIAEEARAVFAEVSDHHGIGQARAIRRLYVRQHVHHHPGFASTGLHWSYRVYL
jgi:hypothetical protein